MQGERDDSAKKVTDLEIKITNVRRMLNHAHTAARAANKKNATAVTELEAELQRATEGRIWARVREEEVDAQQQQLSARSQKVAKERQELANLPFWCKAYEEKGAGYQVKSNRKFFDVEPLANENNELKNKIKKLQSEVTELKGITEPGTDYFH
eukprot:6179677-Pleurochrysis_carterae.AAC.1